MQVKIVKTNYSKLTFINQNTYVVEFEEGCVVVDAGCSLCEIKKATDKNILAVLITHGHIDHIEFLDEFDKLNVPIYANKNILEYLTSSNNNCSLNLGIETTFKLKNLHYVGDNQTIEIGNQTIKCLYTPGHTIDGMCYIINDNMFSGDTLFSISVGRTDLPLGNKQELINSLVRLKSVEYNTLYAGHGATSDKQKQAININNWITYLSK